MALSSGQLQVTTTFPTTMNVAVTNTPNVAVTNTVATTGAQISTKGIEKSYPVTLVSAQIPLADIPVGTTGAQVQYATQDATARLYTKTDATAASLTDMWTTGGGVITLESLLDVQNFRFVGSVGTSIKVVFRGV